MQSAAAAIAIAVTQRNRRARRTSFPPNQRGQTNRRPSRSWPGTTRPAPPSGIEYRGSEPGIRLMITNGIAMPHDKPRASCSVFSSAKRARKTNGSKTSQGRKYPRLRGMFRIQPPNLKSSPSGDRKTAATKHARVSARSRLQIRNGPSGEDAEHDHNADEMRDAEEHSQFSRPPEDGDDDGVKKIKMSRSFGEQAEPEKNPRHSPRQPGRPFLVPTN